VAKVAAAAAMKWRRWNLMVMERPLCFGLPYLGRVFLTFGRG